MQESIVLQPSLTDDSHSRIHFTNWKTSLATAAQGLCRTLDDCGAYSQVATDQEWNAHPSNIIHTTSTAGRVTVTIRARPTFIKPRIYTATEKSTAVINLFNYRELQWKEWTAASMILHRAMINSIGALNLATIQRLSGHAGILSLTCQELLGHITVMFGSLHSCDVFYIENVIKPELTQLRYSREDPAPHQRHHQDSLVRNLFAALPTIRHTHRHVESRKYQRRFAFLRQSRAVSFGPILVPVARHTFSWRKSVRRNRWFGINRPRTNPKTQAQPGQRQRQRRRHK